MELDDSEDRSDGVDFEVGCTEDAQGSCRWRDGATEVVATVDGPTHRTDRAAAQDPAAAASRPGNSPRGRRSGPQRRRKGGGDALHASLLPRPTPPRARAVTTVFCLVIADDQTAAQRCALNAASLALLDARAPMRAIPLAVSVDCGGCAVDVVLDAARDDAAVLALESRGAPVKPGEMLEAVRRAGEDVKALRARVLAGGR